ncbi:MAG: class II glutamine amidotransferase [Gammaproteobacteria bacterium]|nr:class II glutamine amidotransferase [Gammaproteobacteria bacterium]
MCRVLSYLGKPILIEELLYKTDNSFIKQSYYPKYMSKLLNLAGFGMSAWENISHAPSLPFIYKTPQLPFYDENLRNLAKKIMPSCFLAHIRGVPYSEKQVVSLQNVHPFIFEGSNIALAHNGILTDFDRMKYSLLEYILPAYQGCIHGTTDSEWIYAVFLSQLSHPLSSFEPTDVSAAIIKTLKILQRVRQQYNIAVTSPINLFISNGEFIAATRFVFDYGWHPTDNHLATHFTYHSLWYTYGESYGYYDDEYKMKGTKKKNSIIIASEPLTEDTTTWIEVPEYTLIMAYPEQGEIKIISQDIQL